MLCQSFVQLSNDLLYRAIELNNNSGERKQNRQEGYCRKAARARYIQLPTITTNNDSKIPVAMLGLSVTMLGHTCGYVGTVAMLDGGYVGTLAMLGRYPYIVHT